MLAVKGSVCSKGIVTVLINMLGGGGGGGGIDVIGCSMSEKGFTGLIGVFL